jgi:outer membrane lipoprotein SlyB
MACAGALALSAGTASAASKAQGCESYARSVANQQANVAGNTAGAAVFGALVGAGIGAATGNNVGTSAAWGAGAGGVTGLAASSAEWQRIHDEAYADCMYGGQTQQVVQQGQQSQSGQYEPWTDEWFAYCEAKYKSFTPSDGTYQPYGTNVPRKLCQ